jgi:hypothetical protein
MDSRTVFGLVRFSFWRKETAEATVVGGSVINTKSFNRRVKTNFFNFKQDTSFLSWTRYFDTVVLRAMECFRKACTDVRFPSEFHFEGFGEAAKCRTENLWKKGVEVTEQKTKETARTPHNRHIILKVIARTHLLRADFSVVREFATFLSARAWHCRPIALRSTEL